MTPDRFSEKFSKLDGTEPGPRGPAFQRYWLQLLATCEAEDTATSYHGHTCDRSQRGRDEECDGCFGSTRVHNEQMRLRNIHWQAQAELWIMARLYESESRGVAQGARFYATAMRGEDVSLLAGPYDTHEEALRVVPRVKAIAHDVDPNAWTYQFGTVSLVPENPEAPEQGKLNTQLNAPPEAPEAPKKRKGKRETKIAAYSW